MSSELILTSTVSVRLPEVTVFPLCVALIWNGALVPTSPAAGVPVISPVEVLRLAHAGRVVLFARAKVMAVPSPPLV